MSLRSELINLTDWVTDEILSHEYGEISIVAKWSKGRPILIEKAFFDKKQISNPNNPDTGFTGGNNGNIRN